MVFTCNELAAQKEKDAGGPSHLERDRGRVGVLDLEELLDLFGEWP
ncbi:hypothetical protein IMZ48_11675 [Candidatus Bathyarchaeota archaeon]|nr:hypothetical protein [Candidatus Bathyarchaeota archaeon]